MAGPEVITYFVNLLLPQGKQQIAPWPAALVMAGVGGF